MSQILHIFKKDTRRFWIEILLSIVVAIAFAWIVPKEWKITHDPSSLQEMAEFAVALALLLEMSWWVLIARVVHDETLVGDRQFWITRPYQWPKLLAAKVLFFAVWIGVPYALTETWLLAAAGFNPPPYVPGLLGHLALIAIGVLFPLFALAVVTSSFSRLTLTMLGGFVLMLGFTFLVKFVYRTYQTSSPYPSAVLYPLLFAGCAMAITLAYATHRTWLARGVLIALSVLLAISVLANGRQVLVDKAYPRPTSGAASLVNFSSTPTPAFPVEARMWDDQDYIDMPAQYSGVADGTLVVFDDVRFTLTAADGSSWRSPWQKADQHILPGTHDAGLHLPAISPAIYNQFKTGPVTLKVTFATSRYQTDMVADSVFPKFGSEGAVPGVGFCATEAYSPAWLHCRTPLQRPRLTYVAVQWSKMPCIAQRDAISTVGIWIEQRSAEPVIASVWDETLRFYAADAERHGQVCPGSPMKITQFRLADRTRTDFTLKNFVLPANVSAT